MTFLPRRLFTRLVLGLVLVSAIAVGAGAFYLYSRFHDAHSPFYEGTLQLFASEITKGLAVEDGKVVYHFDPSLTADITDDRGAFIIFDDARNIIYATPGLTKPFVPVGGSLYHYFMIGGKGRTPDLYGISLAAPDISPKAYVQLVFPRGTTIIESVLHEFMKDIAWLWIPFLAGILAINIIVVRLALRPLDRAVEEARAIQPRGANAALSEDGVPDDLLPLVQTVNQAFARLREANEAQELFVADMAHELRTPLAVMKLQLAEMTSSAEARKLEGDVRGMERLVEQLLDRAKLGRFRLEPPERVVLQDVVREVAAYLAPEILRQGRNVEVIAGDEPVIVMGWRDDIFRALRNLIENALGHSPDAGLISIEVTHGRTIAVSDQGPGFSADLIDPELRRKRVLRSDRRGGFGLGLSIVDKTMEAHGGELVLSSCPVSGRAGGRAEMRFPERLEASVH